MGQSAFLQEFNSIKEDIDLQLFKNYTELPNYIIEKLMNQFKLSTIDKQFDN